MTTQQSRRYISVTDTAKLVRKALKEHFPGIKFSVKKSAGGGSIYVKWQDGPALPAVEKVTRFFEGATFDCMYDLKSYVTAELDGEEVHFGADYVHCSRSMSWAFVEAVVTQFNKRWGRTVFEVKGDEQHAYVEYDYRLDSEHHWLMELLDNTDAKDMYRAYEAEEERKVREQAEWEAGAAERERQAEADRKQREEEEKARREQEQRDRIRRQQEQQAREQRQREQVERDAFKVAQRAVLSSRYSALIHLGLSVNASQSDINQAFRNKVREMADGRGGYTGDMDFLVQVKEKALSR
jgi:flagellar biosynthesis GTPase FlhF